MRDRSAPLTPPRTQDRPGRARSGRRAIRTGALALGAAGVVVLAAACDRSRPDPALVPDSLLQAELGLEPTDRVHRVTISGGASERVEPAETVLEPGGYVQFSTDDWYVHEVIFETDSLPPQARTFMAGLDQLASPPLVSRGSRFVVSFVDAPPGRYPFRVEGNAAPARGVLVVRVPPTS